SLQRSRFSALEHCDGGCHASWERKTISRKARMTVNTTTIKALLLSTSLFAALPLLGCAGPTNESADEDTSAAADSDGDENDASTSSAFSVASATNSDLGWFGGSGGTSSARISCPTGSVMVGLQGRVGNVIDRVGLVCAALHADGTLGAATTTTTRGGDGGS